MALTALLLLLLGGCAGGFANAGDASVAMEPAPDEGRHQGTLDDLLLEVARQVPGFGGMFIDQDGRLAIFLLDPADVAVAEEAIAAVFGRERIPAGGVVAVQGQYSLLQLKEWYDRLGSLFSIPGVALTDLDEGRNRLTVGVQGSEARPVVEQELQRLGIPSEAVRIEETGPIIPLPGALPAP